MAEDGAATATATEPAKGEETKEPEGKTPEGTQTDKPLGPEGEKALDIWKDRAKKAEKLAAEREERLQKIEDANKSETEKALDKARKEARKEAEAEFEKERRSDRLRVAVAGHARELADVDDVVLNIERGDTDELFDAEGKVNADALKSKLEALLKAKPHLRAQGVGKPQGSADGGEGEGGGGSSFNDQIRAAAGR